MSLLHNTRAVWPRVLAHNKTAVVQSLGLIRKIIDTEQFRTSGLTTAEMFKLALKEPPPGNFEKYEIPSETEIHFTNSGQRKILPPNPPNPEHPVRSIRFLKTQVLPVLEGLKEVRMATGKRFTVIPAKVEANAKAKQAAKGKGKSNAAAATTSAAPPTTISHNVMLWMPTQKPRVPKTKSHSPPIVLSGAAVGAGEDWGHLNKRRNRARNGKVKREIQLIKEVKKAENEERRRLAKEALEGRQKKVEQDVVQA